MCPAPRYETYECRTCCCKSSDNVAFFHPDGAYEEECGAHGDTEYKVSLVPTVDLTCHRDYPYLEFADFSGLLLLSHFGFLTFNKTITEETELFQYIADMETVLPVYEEHFEEAKEFGAIRDFFLPNDEPEPCGDEDRKRRIGYIEVSPYHRYVTAISSLVSDYLIYYAQCHVCS